MDSAISVRVGMSGEQSSLGHTYAHVCAFVTKQRNLVAVEDCWCS